MAYVQNCLNILFIYVGFLNNKHCFFCTFNHYFLNLISDQSPNHGSVCFVVEDMC